MSTRIEPPRTKERHRQSRPRRDRRRPRTGRELKEAVWRSVPDPPGLVVGFLVLATVGMYAAGVFTTSSPASSQPAAVDYRVMKGTGHVVTVNLTAQEGVQQIAPDVKYHVWTFDGTAPGPGRSACTWATRSTSR